MPSVVFIFDFPVSPEEFMPRLRTVLIHTQPVLHARWNPTRKGNLYLCCGNQSVYTWNEEWQGDSGGKEMAECIAVPASKSDFKIGVCQFCLTPTENFETRDIVWARDGKGLILFGKDQFCCTFEVREEDDHVVLEA
jgi:hypothetical protein